MNIANLKNLLFKSQKSQCMNAHHVVINGQYDRRKQEVSKMSDNKRREELMAKINEKLDQLSIEELVFHHKG